MKYIELEEQGKTLAAEKSEVEAALAEALPALEAARFALSQLDKSDITEIRLRMHAFCNIGPMISRSLAIRSYFYFEAYFSTNYPVRISMSFEYFSLRRGMSRQIWTHVREATGSNLERVTILSECFQGFPQYVHMASTRVPLNKSRLPYSKFLPANNSVLSSNPIRSEIKFQRNDVLET